jgi:hypothetical protein
MCVIIDACVRDLVFSAPPSDAAVPVIKWIEEGDGRMAYGGTKLCDELFKSGNASRRIKAWKQAGRAMEFPKAVIDAEESVVRAMNAATSNDVHILALARVRGARVLFSSDGKLHADFKNAVIVDNPRGAIYQTKDHGALLQHSASCRASAGKLEKQLF